MDDLHDWLTLHLLPGLGPVGAFAVVKHFGTPSRVLAAGRNELFRINGIRASAVEAICGPSLADARETAHREMAEAARRGITLVPLDDPRYPEQLKNIHGPPLLLFVKGDPEALSFPCLAMVGSRACTDYGRRVARRMATNLAGRDITIVSGLALGIDTEAHYGALANGGRTVAVLGCGLDCVYPRGNRDLFEKIPRRGALVSEYPLGTGPDAYRFPARNRIISGISLGVVVVEAARNSGSLITARYALEQGREVFAVPGRIDSFKSAGAHNLVQQGAKLVMTEEDILEEFPGFFRSEIAAESSVLPRLAVELSGEERRVLELLDVYPEALDEIAVAASLPIAKVSELLVLLELKGAVKSLPGTCFQRTVSLETEGEV